MKVPIQLQWGISVVKMWYACPRDAPVMEENEGGKRVHKSYKHPLAAPFDKLVQENRQVRKDEPAYVKGEELGRVPGAQLQAHLCLVCVSETGVLDLSGNLI
jgi:hypothetical protein